MNTKIGVSGRGRVKPAVSMNRCYWCGRCKNIVIGKKLVPESKHIPQDVCLDIEPCDECKESFSKGILFAGVVQGPQHEGNLFPADSARHLYYTGSCFVCKEDSDFVKQLPEDIRGKVIEKRQCFLDEEVVLQINKEYNESMGRDGNSRYESYTT